MATKMTKAQLIDENNALRNEINTLRLLVAAAEQARDDAQAHVRATMDSEARCEPTPPWDTAPAPRVQRPAPAPRGDYEMPAWQVARAQQMAAAKQAAMAMRCVVKVEA